MTSRPYPELSAWRFLQLTLFLAAWMIAAPYLTHRWITQVLLQGLLLNSVLVTLWANDASRRLRAAMVGLWLASFIASLLAVVPQTGSLQILGRQVETAATLPLLATLAAGILRYVFHSRRLTIDGIFATVAAYLLVGMLFAQCYSLVIQRAPESFNITVDRAPQLVQSDLTYFSFVTLATLGYGDVLPINPAARSLAVIEAVVGQFYVAVIVAVFVGMYTAQRRN